MAVKAAADRLRDLDSMDNNARYRLALTLALEANANRVAASRLLRSLQPSDPEPDKAKEKKDKKEKKKKKATSEE
ncbi:MAG: hypothetical protein IJU16_02610 [Clostridia bacterium]|nr:hypothetical protein [Clostridia bacterium]